MATNPTDYMRQYWRELRLQSYEQELTLIQSKNKNYIATILAKRERQLKRLIAKKHAELKDV